MAATFQFREHRTNVTRSIRGARAHHEKVVSEQQEAADKAEAEFPDNFTLGQLLAAADEVANSGSSALNLAEKIELQYGNMVLVLLLEKERTSFAARYRDHICVFEDGAFQRMKTLPKYKEALKRGADSLKSPSETLRLLAMMARAEKSKDEDVRAVLTDENKMVQEAWGQAVVAKGLQLEEYAALRDFKGDTNRQSESPEQALVELKKPLAVPEKYAPYKEPLVKLLELLARPATGAR